MAGERQARTGGNHSAQIQSLSGGIKRLEHEICELGKRLKGHNCLTSIKGIGPYSAAVLLAIIGDAAVLRADQREARVGQGAHCYGAKVPRHYLSDAERRLGVRGLPELRAG